MESLLTLIVLSALPIILAYLWLVVRKYQFTMIWFLCALLAGILSILIALCMQNIIPSFTIETLADLFFSIIVKTAIPEELSRFFIMFSFIALSKKWKRLNPIETKQDGAAAGFIVALGFAFFETAGYSVSNLQLTFLRSVTAMPIHAACGIRAGISAVSFRNYKIAYGIWNILLAIIIHTAYNFIILNTEVPKTFLVLLLIVNVISSMTQIKGSNNQE